MTDQIRVRLQAADPAPRDVESSRSPRARALMEQIMSETTPVQSATGEPPPEPAGSRWSSSRRWLLSAAAVAIVVAGVAAALVARGGDDAGTLALTSADAGPAMGMCIQITPDVLAPADVAFDGTVTAVDGSMATLDVEHWYKGGPASTVTVENTAVGQPALIEGVEFAVGSRYLVTATDGVVGGCGLSGPYSTELESLYAQAFPG